MDRGGTNNNEENTNTGGKEGPISFTLTPLQEVEETRIKVIRIQDGETKIVYDKTHKASDESFHETFSGKVGAVFDIYYNDELKETITKINRGLLW